MLLLLFQMREDRVKYSKESGYRGRRRRGNVGRHLLVHTRDGSTFAVPLLVATVLAEETSYELCKT